MDVSFYIGELLELKGKVSVPGLGYFFYQRKNAYYHEREGKFYPPHNQVKFEPQLIDDDLALTQYIADKNDITLPSSQYFTEKYITTAKQEALIKEVPIAHLGWLYTVHGHINFKEGNNYNTDPTFFGFKPVAVGRVGYATFTENTESNIIAPIAVAAEQTETPAEQYEVPAADGPPVIWFIVLGVILALAISAIVVYKFFPSVFAKITGKEPVEQTAPAKAITPVIPKLNANVGNSDSASANLDSTKKPYPVASTPIAAAPTTVESDNAKGHYVIIETFTTKAAAKAAINKIKPGGVEVYLTNNIPGPLFHVAIGNYRTPAEAVKNKAYLVEGNYVSEEKSSIQKINP